MRLLSENITCPACGDRLTRQVRSDPADAQGFRRRWYKCTNGHAFQTYEMAADKMSEFDFVPRTVEERFLWLFSRLKMEDRRLVGALIKRLGS